MKSTIKIALGEKNAPTIVMSVINTDDVRDQLCKQFDEGVRGNIVHAEYRYRGDVKELHLTPLPHEAVALRSYYETSFVIDGMFRAMSEALAHKETTAMVTGSTEIFFEDYATGKRSPSLSRERLTFLDLNTLYAAIQETLFNQEDWIPYVTGSGPSLDSGLPVVKTPQ